MTSPTYRSARRWWAGPVPVPERTPTVNTRMALDRERLARLSMGDETDRGPAPRHLPSWNLSVQAILGIERLLNDGAEPSLKLKEEW